MNNKTVKLIIFIFILIFMISTLSSTQESSNTFVMADMGRISIELPPNWIANKDPAGYYLLSYNNIINIAIDRSNKKNILDALNNVSELFDIPVKLEQPIQFNTDNYKGLASEGIIEGSTIKVLAIALNIDSNFIIFLGISPKDYYEKLVESMEKIIFSVSPTNKKSGYIGLSNLGNYKIKLLPDWKVDFKNQTYVFTYQEDYAVIKLTLSERKDLENALKTIPYIYDIRNFEVMNRETKKDPDKKSLMVEATGIIENKNCGILINIVKFKNDDDIIIMLGYIDYTAYLNDFALIEDIQRIMSTLLNR